MSPEEELDKINEVLDLFKVTKDEGYAIYTTLGRVSWLARKSAQQGVQPTDGILLDLLTSFTPEQLSALKALRHPPIIG